MTRPSSCVKLRLGTQDPTDRWTIGGWWQHDRTICRNLGLELYLSARTPTDAQVHSIRRTADRYGWDICHRRAHWKTSETRAMVYHCTRALFIERSFVACKAQPLPNNCRMMY
ncbi:hypothetical protein FOXG_20702 [Fusarium oxysporum f. sp. lycopersici 4287]|uniref:Uncharacterized protein n=2 Tax=Fusarium oxysporum TaxID=5507 RepID=A0A0J9VPH0_FUSO4|nr:hypothetical protein FOXG_20702 [Fusarium oxysporum f. sp. lycopersici 4287]XP_018250780.1 hypothetical protein FOXG_20702 [Fusarium oxysporum f. sp. lycopersici 4287]XP_018250781.1 hypothetical protein FOXG_20702 [Fusarium oxysporum f. sp. lycopersici 4287]XP_018250782.1 hypothetical protein FOXG_20702 [Fusarium oxysporum f. sp. lycopersici 4287]XP_018250783.1 hypothetical protein FOXG_20702 [Fusarium oxysporum f. sp. lycopersici 4287]XP_018250784.1 hypothetical protein FOXG_20702 [Fusariu